MIEVGVDHINVADISADYGYVDEKRQDNPIKKKSNLILSFMEAILDDGAKFGETEKSLVDRAVRTLADGVMTGMYLQMTLMDIYEMLLQYQEPTAKAACPCVRTSYKRIL